MARFTRKAGFTVGGDFQAKRLPLGRPTPVISSIVPALGDVDGNTFVTITGEYLDTGSARIGGQPLTSVTISSDGRTLTGRTAAHARGAVDVTVDVTTMGSGFEYLDPQSFTSPLVSYDADDAVDGGGGLADSIANASGAGDSTRNLIAATSPYGFPTLKPVIYASDAKWAGHNGVGDRSPGGTGRAFVNQGGGNFTASISQPATWYLVCDVDNNSSDIVYWRLNRSGSLTDCHSFSGPANPNITAQVDGGSAFGFAVPTGKRIIAVVYDGASSAIYVDDPYTPANSGTMASNACVALFTGSFYDDPSIWEWAHHAAYGDTTEAQRAKIMVDWFPDRYKLFAWRRMSASNSWHERDGAHLEYFNGKLWMYGGWYSSTVPGWNNQVTTNEAWYSTDDGASWTQDHAHEESPATSGANAFWTRRHTAGWTRCPANGIDYLYVIGGDYDNVVSDTWRTSDGETWERMSASAGWNGRLLHMVGALDGVLYMMGGQTDLVGTAYNDVWKSTDGGVTWTLVTSSAPWAERCAVYDLVTFQDKLWLIGGGTYEATRTYYNDVWTYDGSTWTEVLADGHGQWTGREYHSVKVFDNKLWILGGWRDANLNDAYYSEDGVTWTALEPRTPWPISHADGFAVTPRGLVRASGNSNGFASLITAVYRLEAHS